MVEDIFKIKPLDKHASKVVVDGHKTVSPFNQSMKRVQCVPYEKISLH